MNTEIDQFARALIEQVRDRSVRSCDVAFGRPAVDPMAKRWEPAARFQPVEKFARMVIADVGLRELAGWYLGSDGWRATYSQERFIEDFPDSPEAGQEH